VNMRASYFERQHPCMQLNIACTLARSVARTSLQNASTLAHSRALTRSSRRCKCMYTDALPRTATLIQLPGGGSSMVVQSSSFSMNGRQVQVPLRQLRRSPVCLYARARAHVASAGLGLMSSDGLGLGFRSLRPGGGR
jgi:hypothetical protein